jgi:hypothetical protein
VKPTPVDWPKIMYVCEACYEHYPEGCGKKRAEIYVTEEGKWICDDCLQEDDYGPVTPAPLVYASSPPPSPVDADAIIERCAQLIDEGVDRPGIEIKQDTCAHGKFGWEDCEACCAAAIRALKGKEANA